MSEELKPCPFCGKNTGYIKKIVVSIDWIIYTSYCENRLCEASLGANNRTYDTPEEAEAAWNTRPLEDALQARVEALEAEAESGIRDWECLSCGWTYRGKDQCPKCGNTAHPLTTEREIAQEAHITALEAELSHQSELLRRWMIAFDNEIVIITDQEMTFEIGHEFGNLVAETKKEMYQIAKKAESALKGEVQK